MNHQGLQEINERNMFIYEKQYPRLTKLVALDWIFYAFWILNVLEMVPILFALTDPKVYIPALYLTIAGVILIITSFVFVRYPSSSIASNIVTKTILVLYVGITPIGLILYIVLFFIPTWKKLPDLDDDRPLTEFIMYMGLLFTLLPLLLSITVGSIMFLRNIMMIQLRKMVTRGDIEFAYGSILRSQRDRRDIEFPQPRLNSMSGSINFSNKH
mmetsp:Transcript_12929/g.11448  ORF Transcript_12929/g.11448 Transcript_12929/m.11448 type:complete len:214 (+) Transcript_12929:38-679(+)